MVALLIFSVQGLQIELCKSSYLLFAHSYIYKMQADTGRCSVYCMSALMLAHTLVTSMWSLGSQTLYLDVTRAGC